MLTNAQIKSSMAALIVDDDGDPRTADTLELLHELLSFREAYPKFKVEKPRWNCELKKFVESH